MLVLNTDVPEAILLPEEVGDLRAHLAAQKAHWFSGVPAHLEKNDPEATSIAALSSLSTAARAQSTTPNKGNTTLTSAHGGALVFSEGVHCGFMLAGLGLDPENWSCAVRFHAPEGNARTLLTLNSEVTENYIFLQQIGGQIILKDQQTTLELVSSGQSDAILLVVAGYSDGRLWLRIGGGEAVTSSAAPIPLEAPHTLYIGCRSNKARLLKTLGDFRLLDLVFWPDRNVLDGASGATLAALETPDLWRPSA